MRSGREGAHLCFHKGLGAKDQRKWCDESPHNPLYTRIGRALHQVTCAEESKLICINRNWLASGRMPLFFGSRGPYTQEGMKVAAPPEVWAFCEGIIDL